MDSFIIAIDERVPGIWKKTEEIAATLDAHIELVPASARQQSTGVEGANKEEARKSHVAPEDWIIPADLDEFIQFPAPLPTLIGEMTASGTTFIMGKFCDRIAQDGALAPTLAEPSIWEQYPLACRVSEMLVICNDHKVTLCRGDCELTSGHHNVIRPSRPLVSRRSVVHHFKWRQGLLEALKRRVETYKRAGFLAFPESERIIEYLDATGRIIPGDFEAVQGWCPDPPEIKAETIIYTAVSKGYDLLKAPECKTGDLERHSWHSQRIRKERADGRSEASMPGSKTRAGMRRSIKSFRTFIFQTPLTASGWMPRWRSSSGCRWRN